MEGRQGTLHEPVQGKFSQPRLHKTVVMSPKQFKVNTSMHTFDTILQDCMLDTVYWDSKKDCDAHLRMSMCYDNCLLQRRFTESLSSV